MAQSPIPPMLVTLVQPLEQCFTGQCCLSISCANQIDLCIIGEGLVVCCCCWVGHEFKHSAGNASCAFDRASCRNGSAVAHINENGCSVCVTDYCFSPLYAWNCCVGCFHVGPRSLHDGALSSPICVSAPISKGMLPIQLLRQRNWACIFGLGIAACKCGTCRQLEIPTFYIREIV